MREGPRNFHVNKGILDAITRPQPNWEDEQEVGSISLKEALEEAPLIEIPLPIRPLEKAEDLPIQVEDISSKPLDEKNAEVLLLGKTSWGETGIAFIDSIALLQDDEGVISFQDAYNHVKAVCDKNGINESDVIGDLREFLSEALQLGVLHLYERYTEHPGGYKDGFSGYIVPTDPAHHSFFLLNRVCNQVETAAPEADNPIQFFVNTVMSTEWPVPLTDFLDRITQRGEEAFGSSLTAMCQGVWPSADQYNLLRLEALTQCAIASGVVEQVDSKVEGYKYLKLTEQGAKLSRELHR